MKRENIEIKFRLEDVPGHVVAQIDNMTRDGAVSLIGWLYDNCTWKDDLKFTLGDCSLKVTDKPDYSVFLLELEFESVDEHGDLDKIIKAKFNGEDLELEPPSIQSIDAKTTGLILEKKRQWFDTEGQWKWMRIDWVEGVITVMDEDDAGCKTIFESEFDELDSPRDGVRLLQV